MKAITLSDSRFWRRRGLGVLSLLLIAATIAFPKLLASDAQAESAPVKPVPKPTRLSVADFDDASIAISLKEFERMASLDSYRINLAGRFLDLMLAADSDAMVKLLVDSQEDRAAYQTVAAISWGRMRELKTNLTFLVDFPGPMPTQLRVHAERILIAMTNSPAVSFPLRAPVLLTRARLPDWEVGNLNPSYSEDMRVLIEQLREYPSDGMIYLEGLVGLFDSAKGYLGPASRKAALAVYLGFPSELKADLKEVLTDVSRLASLTEPIRRLTKLALEGLESVWTVVLNGRRYELNTVGGMKAFIEEGNVRTHFMDHLVVIGTIMADGRKHPEVETVSSWLSSQAPKRLRAFVESPLVRRDAIVAREAMGILRVFHRVEARAAAPGALATNVTEAAVASVGEASAGIGGTARTWIAGHMEIVAGIVLLAFAGLILPQVLSEVRFGKQLMKKSTLYAVADEVMGVLKAEAAGRLERIDSQMTDLDQQMKEGAGSEDLNRRLLRLHEEAKVLKSVAEIGREPDKCPPPQELVKLMRGVGVDVGQIVDHASKNTVASWETRYQMNRNADLVIAAYYKKHFNRFITLVRHS